MAMVDVEREVERYMALPYRIVLTPDPEDGGFAVSIPDLPGCLSQGDTAEEAIAMIRDAERLWLEAAVEDGRDIPMPHRPEQYSGRFNVRMPKSLHRAMVEAADADGVSLNTFAVSALARAVGRAEPRMRKPGRPTWSNRSAAAGGGDNSPASSMTG